MLRRRDKPSEVSLHQRGQSVIRLALIVFFFPSLLALFSVTRASADSSETISVNKNIQYEQMEGFGGYGTSTDSTFITQTIDQLGITIVRDNIPPSYEQTEGTFDPSSTGSDSCHGDGSSANQHFASLKAMVSEATAKGQPLKIILSIWSPPAWMKYVNCVFGEDHDWNRLIVSEIPSAENPSDVKDKFAAYCVAYLQALKQATGVDAYALSIQNEAAFAEPYVSAVYNPAVYAETLGVVGQALKANGLPTKLFGPEDVSDGGRITAYVEDIMQNPTAAQYADIIAVHGYGSDGVTGSGSQGFWTSMHNLVAHYNKELWMTETSGYSEDWSGALSLAGSIYTALKYGQINAWVWWTLANGTGSKQGLIENGQPLPHYYVSQQYYKYIRPGAIQVDSQSPDSDVLVTAFTHPQNHTLTIELINQNASSAKTIALNLQGSNLPGQFSEIRSSATENAVAIGTVNSTDSITLPPSSMVTLYGTSSGTDAPLAPTIQTQPQNASTAAGNPVTFSVNAAGTPGLSYQWQRNGTNIAGAIGSVYTFTTTAQNNGDHYSVVVSNAQGSVTSDAATLSVSPFAGASIAAATTAPTIDGNGNDAIWQTAPSNPLSHVVGAPTNLSASYQAGWDSNNLYLLVKMNDASYANSTDNVELYLDGGNTKSSVYTLNDWQYIFTWGSTKVQQYEQGNSGNDVAGHYIGGITYAQVTNSDGSGYTLEASIPWSTIGVTPVSGQYIGLDIDVAQQDTPGKTSGKLFWNATSDTDWQSPATFGVGVLAKGGGPIADGTYTLTNRLSGLVLDNTYGGGAGTHEQQWTSNGTNNQKWQFTSVGGGYYKVICVNNGLALDIDGASTSQGAAVVIEPYSGADDQLWQVVTTDSGYYHLVNKHSGFVLDDSQNSTASGNPVIQWPINGGNNQQWSFQAV